VFNTEIIASDAVIKGRFLGKFFVEHSLIVYSTVEIKGSFKTAWLIVFVANHFRWLELIKIDFAEIAGELVANLQVNETIVVKSIARLFGDVDAVNLVIEEGAVVVGRIRIGKPDALFTR